MMALANNDLTHMGVAASTNITENVIACPDSLKLRRKLIDTVDGIEEAVNELGKYDELVCDYEGVELGRGGHQTFLQIGSHNGCVYIFDILTLGHRAFELGLKEILESNRITKIMYDCRRDSDSLWHEFSVELSNIFDMQLLEYIVRIYKGGIPTLFKPRKPWHYRNPVVIGMLHCIKKYVDSTILVGKGISDLQIFDTIISVWLKDKTIFGYRPVSEGVLTYTALEVLLIWEIYHSFKRIMPLTNIEKERLKMASQRYAGLRRDVEFVEEVFANSCLLQSYVIPTLEKDVIKPFPRADRSCNGCKRLMPEVSALTMLCVDCREIERVHEANIIMRK